MQDDVRSAVPRMDHQDEDALMFRRQSPRKRRVPRAITTRKKAYVDEQSWIAPQKPNRRTPRARFSSGARVPEAHALPLLRARRGTGQESQKVAEMWFFSGAVAEDGDLD